jgi:hypothetical protein
MRKNIVRIGRRGKRRGRAEERALGLEQELRELDTRVAMIQALVPLGLQAVNDMLQEEVTWPAPTTAVREACRGTLVGAGSQARCTWRIRRSASAFPGSETRTTTRRSR